MAFLPWLIKLKMIQANMNYKIMKNISMIALVTLLVLLMLYLMIGAIMSDVEKPQYKTITSEKNIEVRSYSPMIIAEVELEGKQVNTRSEGFRMLADYISGNNIMKKEIPMTAPVQQQKNLYNGWTISFVMPSKYTMRLLPQPINKKIILKEILNKKFVVISFSGLNSNENITENTNKLIQYIEKKQLKTIGYPKCAFYNPPWTLPFMRLNEVMFEIIDNNYSLE